MVMKRVGRVLAVVMLAALALVHPAAPAAATPGAGPGPGDVFREFSWAQQAGFGYFAATCRSGGSNPCSGDGFIESRRGLNVDPTGAYGAEMEIEWWGGHVGTTKQDFNILGETAWTPIPQPQGTPGRVQCYMRNILGHSIAPVDVSRIQSGKSTTFSFRAGQQDTQCNSSPGPKLWGQYWIYDFTVRLFYPDSYVHPTGSIDSLPGTIGENPVIKVSAQAPAGRTIKQVDLLGNYYDYDWDGNGVFDEWQYIRDHSVYKRHIGTATTPAADGKYTFVWDTRWVPDQGAPVEFMAKITDSAGVSYMTPIASASLGRAGRSVQMYVASNVPENFAVACCTAKSANINVPSLTDAKSARMALSTWSAASAPGSSFATEVFLQYGPTVPGQPYANKHFLPNGSPGAFGKYEWYSIDTFDIPVNHIAAGDNPFTVYSNRSGIHAIEVNWPGPALQVEYVPGVLARDIIVTLDEDTSKAFTLQGLAPAGSPALTFAKLSDPSSGSVAGAGPNWLYTPSPNFAGVDSFTYSVTSGDQSDTGTVTFVVAPKNDAPTVSTGASLPGIDEDTPAASITGASVADVFGTAVGDPDAGALKGVALTGAPSTNGTWQYSTNGGTSWSNVGAVSDTSATLLTFSPTNRIRFVPATDFYGTASLTYRAWDQSDGKTNGTTGAAATPNGGTTAYSQASSTATIAVANVNDAPTVFAPANTRVVKNTTLVRGVSFADPDPDTSWTATVNYGDGGGAQPATVDNANKTVALSHLYGALGTYTVTITVDDGKGGTSSAAFTVAVVDRIDVFIAQVRR